MAEAIGLAGSIVGIATAGVAVVSTLTKFGISYRGSNEKINSLAGRVSLTASILSDIAATVEQNSSGFKKEEFWSTWRKVLSSCENSYGTLEKALSKARRTSTSKDKPPSNGVSVWGKLVWALGGEREMQDLEAALERCCQQVMMMQQAVQMSVLSLIAQRQKLNSGEIEDQRELMSKLQWLLTTLSEAGVLPTGDSKRKQIIVVDEASLEPPRYSSPAESQANDFSRGDEPGHECVDPVAPSRGFAHGFALNSFHAVLPQPTRPPKAANRTSVLPSMSKDEKLLKNKEYFFEAYYIIPRCIPRVQPRGQLQLIKPMPDDYMITCLDIKQDYRKDPNLRSALRRAKKARDSITTSIVNSFPRSVQDTALYLSNHKKQHGNGLTWSLVEGIELRCLEDSMFRKSSAKSGYLVVFRGSDSSRGKPYNHVPESPSNVIRTAASIFDHTATSEIASAGFETGFDVNAIDDHNATASYRLAAQPVERNSTPPLQPILKTMGSPTSPTSSRRVSFESSRREKHTKPKKSHEKPLVIQTESKQAVSGPTAARHRYAKYSGDYLDEITVLEEPVIHPAGGIQDTKQVQGLFENDFEAIHRTASATSRHRDSIAEATPTSVFEFKRDKKPRMRLQLEDTALSASESRDIRPLPGPGLPPGLSSQLKVSNDSGDSASSTLPLDQSLQSVSERSSRPQSQSSVTEFSPSSLAYYSLDTPALYSMGYTPQSSSWTAFPTPPLHWPNVGEDSVSDDKPEIFLQTENDGGGLRQSDYQGQQMDDYLDKISHASKYPENLTGQATAELTTDFMGKTQALQTGSNRYTRSSDLEDGCGYRRQQGIEASIVEVDNESRRIAPKTTPIVNSSISLDQAETAKQKKEQLEMEKSMYREKNYRSDSSSRHQTRQIAAAGVSTAAAVGLVEHFRRKRQRSDREESRSRSRGRTGIQLAAAGLSGAAIAGLYERRRSKGEQEGSGGSSGLLPSHASSRGWEVDEIHHPPISSSRSSREGRVAEAKGESVVDSELEISDSEPLSGSGDEDSTLVEHRRDGKLEELHLTQSEAQAMMMNFLATFTTV